MSSEHASGKLVLDQPADHVARIRISNPEKRGALDHEILDTLAALVPQQDARCLIITGDGPVFSAGYDIGNFSDDDGFSEQAESLVAHPFTEAIESIAGYPYPVVAAINGHAIGGGLEVAVTCDLRIAAGGVKLGMPPAKIGLIYSHTGIQRFIDVCGVGNTNELFLRGRNVDAQRGYEMGLVNEVVQPGRLEAAAVELAAEIAGNAPLALEGNKRVIRALRENGWPLPEPLVRELVDLRESSFFSEDFREGIRSFGEKRAPRWRGK